MAPLLGYAVTERPTSIAGAVIALLVGLILVRRPIWAVYLLFIGTAFDSINIRTGFATFGAADLASIVLIPIWLANRLTSKTNYHHPIGLIILVFFFALNFISMMAGVSPASAYGNYIRLIIYGATLLAVVDIVRDVEALEKIFVIMAVCSLLQAVIGIMMGYGTMRISGLVDQPNLLAVKIAVGLFPMAGLYLKSERQRQRFLLGACVFVMVLAILLTISRGTYIAVIAGFFWWFRRARRTAILLGAFGALAFVGLSQVDVATVNRIEGRLEFDDSSVVNRAVVAKNALRAAAAKPFLGVGFGQFNQADKVISIIAEKKRGAHSFYLSLAASSGIPALVFFILFVWIQWRHMSQALVRLERRDLADTVNQRVIWIATVCQPLIICHATGLTIRGSQRLTEWSLLALYCTIAVVLSRHAANQDTQSGEPSEKFEPQRHAPIGPHHELLG